jgi:predicted PurR-regulated permease PerM
MGALQNNSAWQRMAITLATFVVVVLAITCLYVGRGVLIPIAVALLLTFILSPAVSALQRWGVRRTPAVLITVLLAGILLGGAVWLVGSQMVQLLAELPAYQENVAKRITEVRQQGSGTLLRNVQRFIHEITSAASGPQSAADGQPVSVRVVEQAAASSVTWWLGSLQPVAEPVITSGLVIVLVIYMLIFREDLRGRVLALVGRGHLTVTTKALDDAGRRISRYLAAQLIVNVLFGIVISLGLLVIGVPHALLWGFAGGLLRYIPYLGPWLACALPIGMSLLISDRWMQPLSVVALFVVVELITNLIAEPWLYGHSIGVSQAALMVAILFWTWLWGAVGLMLAAPLTTCLVVMGKYIPALKFFDVLLGDEEVLTPDVGLYQRLLARDDDEAFEIVRRQSQTLSPLELGDKILLPPLVHVRQDYHAGLLDTEDYEHVLSAVRSIAEQHDLAGFAEASRQTAEAVESDRRPPLSVLACPAQDGAEQTALDLFQQLIDSHKFQLDVVSPNRLVSEILEFIDERRPTAVLIVALPSGGLAHTRHLCKRIRARFPEQKLLIGRWGGEAIFENREQWAATGGQYLGTTFAESLQHLNELAQFLRPVAESPTAAAAVPEPPAASEPAPAREPAAA